MTDRSSAENFYQSVQKKQRERKMEEEKQPRIAIAKFFALHAKCNKRLDLLKAN